MTPDEEVAANIIEAFIKETILSPEGINRIKPLLASGKLRQEDWKLIFESDQLVTEEKDV